LKNQWGAESAAADDNLLPGSDYLGLWLLAFEALGWDDLNTDCFAILDNDLVCLGVAHKVQVLVY